MSNVIKYSFNSNVIRDSLFPFWSYSFLYRCIKRYQKRWWLTDRSCKTGCSCVIRESGIIIWFNLLTAIGPAFGKKACLFRSLAVNLFLMVMLRLKQKIPWFLNNDLTSTIIFRGLLDTFKLIWVPKLNVQVSYPIR